MENSSNHPLNSSKNQDEVEPTEEAVVMARVNLLATPAAPRRPHGLPSDTTGPLEWSGQGGAAPQCGSTYLADHHTPLSTIPANNLGATGRKVW